MKRSILLIGILFFVAKTFAQEQNTDNSTTISVNYSFSDPSLYGISAEFDSDRFAFFNHHTSTLLNISATHMEYDNNLIKAKGTGFAVELGRKIYKKRGYKSGLYFQWLLGYSSTNFNENTPLGNFNGTYSYWNLINQDIGYKIKFAKNFSVDPSIGYNWKLEVKGKGDIDNIYSDNFVFRCGVKIGYSF